MNCRQLGFGEDALGYDWQPIGNRVTQSQALTGLSGGSIVLEQLPSLDVEALCNPPNVVNRHVTLSPLNRRHFLDISEFLSLG
jgi:hypothetical protein